MLIVFAATVAHLIYQPFEVALMDNMEMFSLSTSFLTFFSGLMLFAPEGLSDNDKIIYSLLIVVSNALFFAVSIYKLVSLMLVCVCTRTLWCVDIDKI